MTSPTSLSVRGRLKRLFERFPFLPALIIFAILLTLNGIFSPASVSPRGLTGLISTYLALMLLAIGQTFVVYAGDIDFSIGVILSLVNVTIIVLMQAWGGDGLSVLAAIGIGLLVGLAAGLVNGFVVAVLRLQAVVATFATSILFTGAALYVLPVAGMPAPRIFWRTYGGRIFDIPFVVLAALAIALVVYLLARTRLITQLLSVGDSAQSAYQTGLPVTLIRVGGYALSGVFAALAALCVTGDTASGDPLVGAKMTLFSVAAVVLGGTALSGGFGTVVGSALGAFIIGLINALVYFVGTPSQWQNLVQGLVILIALMFGIFVSRRARA